uniref:Uncharacterized protein n=1 Tax=Oryza meridionalis TaxID=40149 RepID=A0A0E0F1Q7_9ORYZ
MNTVEEQERREEQGGRGTCAKSAPHPLVLTTMTDIVLAANKSSHPPTMYYIDEQAQQACGCWPANAKEETWPSQGALIFLI